MSTPNPTQPTLHIQSLGVISQFANEPGVTADQVKNLTDAITASPELVNQFNNAVSQGHLKAIKPLANPNAGGEYHPNSQEMHMPLGGLTTPTVPGGPGYNQGEITFVLGHELQHGFNRTATAQAYSNFETALKTQAQQKTGVRDYTDEIDTLIKSNRRDEAGAEIAGFNAIVSAAKVKNPNATLGDIYEMQPGRLADFIDRTGGSPSYTYTLKPNLTQNPDMTLTANTANLEAMGKNYFDKAAAASKLGHHGNSDYTNYYGAYAIGRAAIFERHYNPTPAGQVEKPLTLDMKSLKLDEKLVEENGINLGTNTARMPYSDIGQTPAKQGHFDHTSTTHTHVPIAAHTYEEVLRQAGMLRPESPALNGHEQQVTPRDPRDPDHPQHGKQQSVRGLISDLYQRHGQSLSEEQLDSATACVMRDAQKTGLKGVGALYFSENYDTRQPNYNGNLIALERVPREAHDRVSATPIEDTRQFKPEQAYQQYEQAVQQQQQLQQVQQQNPQPEPPTQRGPSM